MKWSAEQYQLVKDLWPTHSAAAIAKEISDRYHQPVSRSMVTGIVHRLQLERKGAGRLSKFNALTSAHHWRIGRQ